MNSVLSTCLMQWQLALGILGFCEDFCGDVLKLKNEFAKVSEFLNEIRIGFGQENDFWSKFEQERIWKFWIVEPNVFDEMGCGYHLVAEIILARAEDLGII